MNNDPPNWLPDPLLLSDAGGDWAKYVDRVYAVFYQDFVATTVHFRGAAVTVGTQLIDGKERTFWHLTAEGNVETDRTPDMRRCEAVCWIRPVIEHDGDPSVLSWPNQRGRHIRQVLWVPSVNFAVVLEQRQKWMLWTTYCTDRPHTQRRFMNEYDAYQKTI